MIDVGKAVRENFKEALSALLEYQREHDEDGIDFDSGREPWILIDSEYSNMCVDVKCSSAKAVDNKIKVLVESDYEANIMYDQWYNVNIAEGYTENNVYEQIINFLKNER